jgi:NAD(P) transhydrogenase
VEGMTEYDLVVVGSGPAGQKAAISAAKLGKKVAIVERKLSIGGVCLHKGTIPSKTLREAVSYLSGVRQRELYGASYRVKDKITMQDLTFRTQRVIESETNVVQDQLIRNYVDIVPGTGRFTDSHTIVATSQDESRILKAEKIIIAVGTKPARPANIEFDDERVIDSDGLLNLKEIPRTMTFVGAGIVGTEYATIFRVMGVRVTLIDGRERPLDFVDDEIEDALYFHMRDEGITLRFGEKVCAVQHTDDGRVRVTMESGKELTSDSLMFAAGRQGSSKDLGLESVGLNPDSRGRLKVNKSYQTEVEHIYAVGDIIGFPSLASTSMEQGRIAALHAFGVDNDLHTDMQLPYGVYTIPEISMVGPTEQDLTRDAIPYEVGVARFRELSRVHISGGSVGILKLLFHRETYKLIAVHVLGESATELIHIGQAVIDHGGSVKYFRDAVFNYPTLAEAYKVAALDGLNKMT